TCRAPAATTTSSCAPPGPRWAPTCRDTPRRSAASWRPRPASHPSECSRWQLVEADARHGLDRVIRGLTSGYDARSDQNPHPDEWIGIDKAVTFTQRSSIRYTTLDRLGGYASSTTPPRAVGRVVPSDRGTGAGRGATTDSREVVTWPLSVRAHQCGDTVGTPSA